MVDTSGSQIYKISIRCRVIVTYFCIRLSSPDEFWRESFLDLETSLKLRYQTPETDVQFPSLTLLNTESTMASLL